MSSAVIRQPNFAVLLGATWLLSVLQLTAAPWDLSAVNLVDGDDALRLLQVRDFMAGQGWFDLHQARLDPPQGYDSHWSRLIDVGLAGFILVFNAFADRGVAESLTLIVWPVLWLVPTIGGVAAITWRLAGRQAAIIALLLCAFGLPGFQQFKPGRIDHHNVQIALAILIVAATVWSDRLRWTARAAGALTGLALAVGLESLLLLALCGVAFALRFTVDRYTAPALRDYGLSLSIGTLVAFFVSVAPDHWIRSQCDQIAINYVAAVVAGGFGLIMAAGHFADERGWVRWAATAAAGGGALVVFVLFEPRCLAGPYALIDPKIVPIFLTNVAEMQSLPYLLRANLSAGVATAAFPATALLAAFMVAARSELYRDFGFLMASAAFLVACAVTFVAFKGYPYAMWLGVPLVAAAAFYFFNWLKLTSLVPRFVAALMVTPMTISFAALSITAAASHDNVFDKDSTGRQTCVRKENYELLARLPAGLVVANELEWGSYLLLWTPHSILGGPYHRLSDAIVMTHQAFALTPDEAHAVLTRVHADYLVTCGSRGAAGLRDEQRAASLWGRLRVGELPEWLEQIVGTERQAFTIYRVKPRS